MSSIRFSSVPGSRFGAAVERAGDAVAQPEEKLRLPDGTYGLLISLPRPTDPGGQAELQELLGARLELNERTLKYVERRLAERRVDLEAAHELAKGAVRDQKAALEKLQEKLGSDQQYVIRAQNVLTRAQTEAAEAAQPLSRFAAHKDMEAARKRIESANEKVAKAEHNAGELLQMLNYAKTVTWVAEQKKLNDLMEREFMLSEELSGRDPHMKLLGIQPR